MLVSAITRGEPCYAPIGDGTDALEANTDMAKCAVTHVCENLSAAN
jgi:hypothetical protein